MNLDPQQLFQLIFLLAALALFCVSLRGHMRYAAWFRRWEAGRKARRDAEIAAHSPSHDASRRGPWD